VGGQRHTPRIAKVVFKDDTDIYDVEKLKWYEVRVGFHCFLGWHRHPGLSALKMNKSASFHVLSLAVISLY
jgi:hypothetical protein